jgi:serine/threonine protein kinase
MPHPGELLGGRYRLDDRIAAGGMGEVWQATDTVLKRDVAVKTLLADRATDRGFQRRFRHEARALAALRHPGVVTVYDFGSTDTEDAYLVMARVDGEPLNRVLGRRGRLTPGETMSVVAQAAQALEAAHKAGIVHRDVKPGNLLIEPDGTVVLVDFGVSRSAHSGTVTGPGEVVGTALYIAPEQVARQKTGPAADVYALGALAYHCLAGHPPFQGQNPIAIALQHLDDDPPPLPDDIPAEVRAMVRTALSKNPADRFPSAGAMAQAASSALTSPDTPPNRITGPNILADTAVGPGTLADTIASPHAPADTIGGLDTSADTIASPEDAPADTIGGSGAHADAGGAPNTPDAREARETPEAREAPWATKAPDTPEAPDDAIGGSGLTASGDGGSGNTPEGAAGTGTSPAGERSTDRAGLAATKAGAPWIGVVGMHGFDTTASDGALASGAAETGATDDGTGKKAAAGFAGAGLAGIAARRHQTDTSPASTSPAATDPSTTGPAATGPAHANPATTGQAAATGPAHTNPAATGAAGAMPGGVKAGGADREGGAFGDEARITRPAAPAGTGLLPTTADEADDHPSRLSPVDGADSRDRKRRLLPVLILAAVVLFGVAGVLAIADPFGLFTSDPKPTTNAPASPATSVVRSPSAESGEGIAGEKSAEPEKTERSRTSGTRSPSPAATRPAEPPATTEPTGEATTGTTSTPEQTATSPAETDGPGEDEGDPDEQEAG